MNNLFSLKKGVLGLSENTCCNVAKFHNLRPLECAKEINNLSFL